MISLGMIRLMLNRLSSKGDQAEFHYHRTA